MSKDFNALETAEITNNLVNRYIVSPVVNLGIAGFEFDIFEEHKSELQAEITDHFVEDNSTRQDHIAIKPERFTLRGFVGELVDRQAGAKSEITELAEKLTIINSYIPIVTSFAKQLNDTIEANKVSVVDSVDETIGTGVDLFQAYKELNPPDTLQAKGYNFFQALFRAKQLVSVETPFGFKSDYAIENVIATQGDNKYISEFSVVLKEFRTTTTELVDFDVKKTQGRLTNQKAEELDQGTANGVQRKASLFFQIKEKVINFF
jgi:hypothetical protein